MKRINRSLYYLVTLAVVLLSLAALSACGPKATPTPTPTPTPTGPNIAIDLIAQDMAFDKSTITVPAGASVTINFDNKDNIGHNFALYTNSSATHAIFVGKIITASQTTYNFTAPGTPGNYFFRCDVHPTSMTGTFVVQ